MDLSTFYSLLTPTGQNAISAAMALKPREEDFLLSFQILSRTLPPELARASLEIAILRLEGQNKFPNSTQMYFTREALQQASSHLVSSFRAHRYKGFDVVLDLGCSIGGDTLSLAQITPTIGIDNDPLRLGMAKANICDPKFPIGFIQADIRSPLPLSFQIQHLDTTAIFFDPARRKHNRRAFSVRDYEPPLGVINGWFSKIPSIGVKISPGVNLDEVKYFDAEIEFVSLRGGLKEAVLWFGALKSGKRRATLLPGPHTMARDHLIDVECSLSDPLAYIYEPDPAILRAGLVRKLANDLGAYQLDPEIAYLTSDKKSETPFARVWEVEAWFPFQLKNLRSYLRERGVGQVVVKKRGSPIKPESLIHDLRLNGEAEKVVFLTHLRGRPIVVIGLPMIKLPD